VSPAGVLLALLAACCFQGGYVIQAVEARAEGERRGWLLRRLARRGGWVAGLLVSVAGAALQVVALTLAPVAVVQPVIALGLVLLLVLARAVLREPVGAREAAGVAAVVAGVSAAVVAAPDLDLGAVDVPGMAALLTALAAGAAACRLLGRDPRLLVLCTALASAFAVLCLKLVADAAGHGSWGAVLAWAAAAGLAGLLALDAEMRALQRLAATRVAPVVLAAQVLVPVAAAALLLGEDWSATPLGGALLAAATLVVAGGAALLGFAVPDRRAEPAGR
jgi:drug/metabolite transporter (DMT)-like permease